MSEPEESLPHRTSRPSSRGRGAILTTVAGVVFAVGGLAFVVQRISATWDETGPVLRSADPVWLTAAVLLAGAGMTAIALPWTDVLRVLGAELDRGSAVLLYYVGEIGKYLPGGVWPVVGRGEMAVRTGIRRTVAYSSVLFSLAALYLAALLLAAGLLPVVLVGGGSSSTPVLLVLLVPVGLLLLHPRILGSVLGVAGRLTKRDVAIDLPSWPEMVAVVLRYVPSWLFIGSATWAVARSLDADIGWVEVCFATVLSWSAGFLVAPAPGGVGIREAAFVAVAASLPSGIAAAVAICARLVFMLVDTGGAALSGSVLGARRRSTVVSTVDPDDRR